MLRELRIKNLAIVDDLKVEFEKGFNVITGETGAGKSIIVDSLGLALGARAQSDLIKTGEKEAVVQAYFEVEETDVLPDIGVDLSEDLILRRAIYSTGKSRAYINDTLVSLQSLAEIGRFLVDIHGQHEHQSLLSVDYQRRFVDSFGKLQGECEEFGTFYRKVEALRKEEAELTQRVQDRVHRIEILRYQIGEIDSASIAPGEKAELAEKKEILSNLGRLTELAGMAYLLLYGADGSCTEKLSSTISQMKEMASIDHSASEVLEMLEAARPFIDDAAVSLRAFRDKYEFEPGMLAAVDDRLELIKGLEKKYGEGVESLNRFRNEAEAELRELELADERIGSLKADLAKRQDALLGAALALSGKRRKAAAQIEKLVGHELRDLAFGSVEFVVDVKKDVLSPCGIDKIEFLFSANPGEPPKPLAKIASGGELSRVMLALKSILAGTDSIPVLIFDEVDSGIGGKTAETVGKKLKALSDRHQILCTTHLPQIACVGDFHLKTEKKERGESVSVEVREISGSERINEIARMLSGKITDVSLKHAKELIEGRMRRSRPTAEQ